jgi:pullulanase
MRRYSMKSNFEAIIGRSIRMFRRIARLIAFALLAGATLSLSACNSGDSGAGSGGSGSIPAATMRVHYFRADGSYANWGVYSWQGPKTPSSGWPGAPRFLFTTADGDGWGQHADIAMDTTQSTMQFLINQPTSATTANKDCPIGNGNNQPVTLNSTLASTGQEIWVVSGDCTVYTQKPGKVTFSSARAVWLTSDTLIWPGASASNSYQLLAAANGGITASTSGVVSGGTAYALNVGTTTDFAALPAAVQAKYPGATVLKVVTPFAPTLLASLLTGEVAIVQSANGTAVDGTQLQLAPVLDSLYAANAQSAVLGLSFAANVPTFKVWAPTAKSVSLNIYDTAAASTPSSTPAMAFDSTSGLWHYTAPDAAWTNLKYYSYSVNVYSRPANNAVVTNTVVDPYAVSLNALDTSGSTSVSTSLRSMVLDLAGITATPTGWSAHALPPSLDGTDSALYELHVRDFSATDTTVAAGSRGKFEAFASANAGVTDGLKHLAALQLAGLTHVHLLPVVEFASVDEVHCSNPLITLSTGADLVAEAAVVAAQNTDCFNWGYDPIVYGVPEGSYSSNAADGSLRVREFRDMVMGLHSIGLRVVMDVVYNHTPASGQGDVSILDKIVPGYYYRLDGSGNVTGQSGAGSDIAAENAMTEKLVIDTLTRWADQYKVDGFRFDIMSLMPKQVMLDAQSAVNAVALADHRSTTGGPGIYLYGEGWSQSGLSFTNAQQLNMANTGIGTFNDRLRDAVRGGGPFDSGTSMVSHQGFVNGLCFDNNDSSSCNTTSASLTWCGTGAMTQQQCLYLMQNRISVGLAGNLASFPLNTTTIGSAVDYFGGPTGYTAAPQENIAYISVHDNETVFDISQYKHPVATLPADRARAQVVGLSLVALAQGVPFFHAGDDMLRSKSMDGNSYNSGDYFNLIDWSGLKNNWAVGAPPQNTGNNATNLLTMTPLLNNPGLAVTSTDINHTTLAFQDFLRLRKDTTMFRLKTAAAINGCVSFPDQGAQQPGLIVMSISGAVGCGDSKYKSIVVLFNANKIAQTFTPTGSASYAGKTVNLHIVQVTGSDTVVKGASFTTATGLFSVPARTTAVFVEN